MTITYEHNGVVPARRHQHGVVTIAVLTEPPTRVFQSEPAKRRNDALALVLDLHEGQDLLHERTTRALPFQERFADHVHSECLAGRRNEAPESSNICFDSTISPPEEYEKTLSTSSENAAFAITSTKLSRNFSVSQ